MERKDFLKKSALAALAGLTLPEMPFLTYGNVDAPDKELDYHKIRDIRFFNTLVRYPRNVGKNSRRDNHGTTNQAGACIIRTDKGASGWALTEGRKEACIKLASTMTGRMISELFSVKDGMLAPENKVFETAYLDLAGNILNKPAYKLLGAKKPVPNKCYSGMIYFDDLDPKEKPRGIDKLMEECRFDYDFGYRQFKLKIGRGNMWMERSAGDKRDTEVTLEIAKAFPDCEILVDANDGYTPEGFIAYLKSIGDTKLFWVEEPFAESMESCKKLRSFMKTSQFANVLYAEGEAAPDFRLMEQLIDEKLIDVILYDVIGYGFAKWRELYQSLGKSGMLASPHAWGNGIKSNYIAHLGAAFGNTATIEGVTSYSDDVDLTEYKLKKGMLTPPDLPGFGMRLLKKDI